MSKSRSFSFSTTPSIKMSRTKMPLSYGRTMSASMGDLHLMYFEEVLPGDTFKVKSKIVSRLTSSFVKPAFANIFCDTYYFFVPARLVYDDWANVFGENSSNAWSNDQSFIVPSVPIGVGSGLVGTVFDDFELPIFADKGSYDLPRVSILPFRANALVYNEWFRDENYIQPMKISTGAVTSNEKINTDSWSVTNYTGKLPKVSKYHDYFTSVLPSPQKGSAVDVLPDYNKSSFLPLIVNGDGMSLTSLGGALRFGSETGSAVRTVNPLFVMNKTGQTKPYGTVFALDNSSADTAGSSYNVISSNVGVSNPLASAISALTVNDLRLAFQTQKMLEKDAMYGTRYVEYLLGHFGVSSPDARLQRPEFLGGRRLNIGISQVAQTSASNDDGSLGSLGGYSLSDGSTGFSKGFVEHGFILGYCVYRAFHTYQQGLDRRFTRFNRLDFYDPVFANIGNQPVMQSQIYGLADPENVFGYQEAWADYRFHPNTVTGQMRSVAENSLDMWHIADEYSSAPVASKAFLEETPNFLDRVISVDSSVQDQFILDIWHDVEATRVMPLRSVPGLIDHH